MNVATDAAKIAKEKDIPREMGSLSAKVEQLAAVLDTLGRRLEDGGFLRNQPPSDTTGIDQDSIAPHAASIRAQRIRVHQMLVNVQGILESLEA
jgi:hypothetical protein